MHYVFICALHRTVTHLQLSLVFLAVLLYMAAPFPSKLLPQGCVSFYHAPRLLVVLSIFFLKKITDS